MSPVAPGRSAGLSTTAYGDNGADGAVGDPVEVDDVIGPPDENRSVRAQGDLDARFGHGAPTTLGDWTGVAESS